MKKRVLLIGYNFSPEPTGIGKYSGEKIDWLVKNGYECTVITSYPYYPYWKVQHPYSKNRFWYKTETFSKTASVGKLTIHRCPQYVPSNPSGFNRMLLDLTFTISAFFKLSQILFEKKFDVILNVVPSFQIGLLGALYKRIRGGKFVYHIQDLQIEAARDLEMIKSEKVINALFKVERYIFSKADVISSISEGMVNKIRGKACKEISLFPNWVDTEKFFPIENRSLLKRQYGFDSKDKIVLYSGAIGNKQGLELILDAAREMQRYESIKFVICGSGPYKNSLIQLAKTMNLSRVSFLPLQPSSFFNTFLNMADVHLVIQKGDAGDLVMPSKLGTILAIGGVTVVTANEGSTLHSLVTNYKIGVIAKPEDVDSLVCSIDEALGINRELIKEKARWYAERFLCIDSIMGAFEKEVLETDRNGEYAHFQIQEEHA